MPKISSTFAFALTLLATLFQLLAAPFEITKTNVNRYATARDINLGSHHITTMHNGKLYFAIDNRGANGQIWTTNGTAESTKAISSIPFHESATITSLTSNHDGLIAATESSFPGGEKIWFVETETGKTTLIHDFANLNFSIGKLYSLNNLVYFTIATQTTNELWVTDTKKKTYRLHTLGDGTSASSELIPSGDGLIFETEDGTWYTRGSHATTTRISNKFPAVQDNNNMYANINGITYFFVSSEPSGSGSILVSFNPKTLALRSIYELNPSTAISEINVIGSQMYFFTGSASGTYNLWQSDGTRSGTSQLLETVSIGTSPYIMISDGSIYYGVQEVINDISLYRYTESNQKTLISRQAYVNRAVIHRGITYVTTYYENDSKIYALSGDELKEVTDTSKFGHRGPVELVSSDNNFLYYLAQDHRGNLSYYSYNLENDESVKLLHSIYNDYKTIMGASEGIAYVASSKFIKTNGSIMDTILIEQGEIPTFPTPQQRYLGGLYTDDEGTNYLTFRKNDFSQEIVATVPHDLYRSDYKHTSEDLVYGLERKNKCEIYRYSPESNELKMIAKAPIATKISDYYCGAVSVHGRVFFITPLEQWKYQLWSCSADGGDLVCHSKAQEHPTIPFLADYLSVTYANGRWYFPSYTEKYGVEMWSTNGTLRGTKIVEDLVQGPRGSFPSYIHNSNNKIFFVAGTENANETDVYCLDVSMPLQVEILNASGNFDDFTTNVPTQTLKITNCSGDPIEQIHLTFATSDFSTESSSFTLKQGESKIVRINYMPASFGEVEDQLTLSASGIDETTIKNLKGFYEPSIDQLSINGRPFSDAPIAGRNGIRFRYTPPNGYTRDVSSITLFVDSVIVETAFVNGEILWIPSSSGVKNIELVLELSNGSKTIITSKIEVYGIEQDGIIQGDFLGLLEHADGNYSLQGRAQIHASETGAFSGNLKIGKNQVKLKGVFSQNGTFQKTYKLTSGSLDLTVSRYVDESSGILCEAFYTSSDQPSIVHRVHGRLKPALPEEQRGNYQAYAHDYVHVFDRPTMNNSGWENMDGYSFGTMTIRNDLSCTLRGTLANGEKWTSSSKLTEGSSYPLLMNGNRGSVASCELGIGNTYLSGGEAAGKVRWYAPQIKHNNVQPQSAYIETEMAISAKMEPETNDDNIFAIGESTVSLVFNGNQINPTITTKNRFLAYSDEFNNKLNATISRKQGTIQGNASILSNEEVVEETFFGMYFPPANRFLGFSRSKYGYRYFECGP
jgi:ELWxxDGT repeat protein